MFAPAALSGPAPKLGVIVLALLVCAALLAGRRAQRAVAMMLVLILAPVLLLADIWHSPQISIVHRHPALAAVGALVLAGVLALAVRGVRGRAWLLAPLIVAAQPFRIPIQAGGTTSNLLVPLYAVLLVGVVVYALETWRPRDPGANPAANPADAPASAHPDESIAPASPAFHRPALWLARLIAAAVLLYGVQATYSADFEKALQQMVFFYAPFALVFCLLRDTGWTPRVLRVCLVLGAGLAVLFAFIGFAEYATKTIILNPKLVVQNDLHTYFTVNSVFFDPDIFGRFLALVMIILAASLLSARRRWEQLALTVVLAILWVGLVLTLSRSSLGALLVGLGTLAALRWRASRTLAIGAAIVLVGAIAILASPTTFGLNQGLNGASSGRAGLVSGGAHMFGERPLWGFGSGSFVTRYRQEHPTASTLAASHTIAITIAAEQGLMGEIVYIALVLVALLVLIRDARGHPARAAVGAAFVALVLHTNLYADFLEDPVTWTLLGIGVALARRTPSHRAPERHRRSSPRWYEWASIRPRTRSSV